MRRRICGIGYGGGKAAKGRGGRLPYAAVRFGDLRAFFVFSR